MNPKENVKFITEIDADSSVTAARRPFKVELRNRRRFVRIEISPPITMHKLRDESGAFYPDGDWHTINGQILNISTGGILVSIDQQVTDREIVALEFTMQDVESVSHVLGLVKRVDPDDGGFIAGIQFIRRDQLVDMLSQAEIDLLPDRIDDFESTIRKVLRKYTYVEETDA